MNFHFVRVFATAALLALLGRLFLFAILTLLDMLIAFY